MSIQIHGHCDPAFLRVKEVFEKNFVEEGELGAACTLYVDGSKTVDLWGGYTDAQGSVPWKEDTLVGFYSAGKPLAALCALQLIDAGRLELDAPVCRWWPEFAASGKSRTTVRQLLCHQAGLPAIRKRMPEGAMLDWELMVEALAEQAPWFIPGSEHAYHTNTYGFLVGELVRRISGQGFGRYFADNVAEPLGAEVFFGLAERDLPRVAELVWHPSGNAPDPIILDAPMSEDRRMMMHAYLNPTGFSSMGVMNTRGWRMAEIPSSNGHGTARGIAQIYHVLSHGGSYGGHTLVSQDMLDEATCIQSEGYCPVLEREVAFSLGFQRSRPERPLGPNLNSYGHYGTGGSLGFADPDARLGFGYVLNDIVPRWQNSRNHALVNAIYECV
ncbi:MAG: beta-lactamase family protein [Proteobacteria bacterium]|nr:beta-lactamase family protein [Pseudomonadota bacterium]